MDTEPGCIGGGTSVSVRHQQNHLMEPSLDKAVVEVGGGRRVVDVRRMDVPLVDVLRSNISNQFSHIVMALGVVAQD